MTFFEELKWRELIYMVTDDKVIDKINEGGLKFYLGTDPTGDSLHVGHLLVYIFAKRLYDHGHTPIFLIGGATGSIGDPKPNSERKLLSREQIDYNAHCLHNQVLNLFNCKMVNNYDWTHNIDILTFLRTYGKFFNVNYMINKETVKARLDSGISYAEFSYQILQALDFEHLYKEEGVTLQIGGQDQWGNITSGLELIRKMHPEDTVDPQAYGVTIPLVLKSDGTKFGKSESGAVWIDPNKTSPYEFYQFWINTPDTDVIKRLKQFTFLSKEEIEKLEISLQTEPHLRLAQKALAKEITTLIHGEDKYLEALKLTEALFSGKISDLTAKQIEDVFKGVANIKITEDTLLIDTLVNIGAAKSKREARDFITGNGVSVNGSVVNNLEATLSKQSAIENKYSVIRRGKKNYYLVIHE